MQKLEIELSDNGDMCWIKIDGKMLPAVSASIVMSAGSNTHIMVHQFQVDVKTGYAMGLDGKPLYQTRGKPLYQTHTYDLTKFNWHVHTIK